MGKNRHTQDRMYITPSEWARSYGGKQATSTYGKITRLAFDCCALSLTKFSDPVCAPDGTVFEILNIVPYLRKHGTHPITGDPLATKDLVKLHFHKNSDGEFCCPVSFKVFTEHSHIVAVRPSGNVYEYGTVQELNLRAKNMTDLVSGEPFVKADLIHIQDPSKSTQLLDIKSFHHIKHGHRVGQEAADKARADPMFGINATLSAKRVLDQVQEADKNEDKKGKTASGYLYDTRPEGRFASSSLTSTSVGLVTTNTAEDALLQQGKQTKEKGYVRLATTMGSLNLELHCDAAPLACENFLTLCARGYYNGVVFHRSIPGFMLQGGDPKGDGTGGESMWGKSFRDETNTKHKHSERGVLSMANRGPNTNGSQFFITYGEAPHLDGKHTVFGRLVGGKDTLSKIETVPTDKRDRPTTDIEIMRTEVFVNPFAPAEPAAKKKKTR